MALDPKAEVRIVISDQRTAAEARKNQADEKEKGENLLYLTTPPKI